MHKVLSALNWVLMVLALCGAGFLAMLFWPREGPPPLELYPVLALLSSGPALTGYLAYATARGRGRILQTLYAVFSLSGFPFGTAYGIFALWVCWKAEKDFYDSDGARRTVKQEKQPEVKPPAALEETEARVFTEIGTPYDFATRLVEEGLADEAIQARLYNAGLSGAEIDTLMSALGRRFSFEKQRQLEVHNQR